MTDPFINYTELSTEELLDKNKELTQKLYKLSTTSPIYQQVLDMRDMVQLEYNERMQIQLMKSKQGEKIIEIGEVDSTTYTPDYKDDREKFIHNVASSYINKGDEDE
tara:strand:- start:7773 stop:8093 length:321 start_codon:yes stop_codon:yes gene_type:complete